MLASDPVEHACFHCGLPLPIGQRFSARIDGVDRPLCCAGCEAVAQAIVANGLEAYYRQRKALPERPDADWAAVLPQLTFFDHPEAQKDFVRQRSPTEREASLILEGITCSACVWLNERQLMRLPGVTVAEVNYATRRARVCWDERRIHLSDILAAVAAIGYRAHPYDPARLESVAEAERRVALKRIFIAGLGMMQVMMYALPAYLAGQGFALSDLAQLMRWVSLILTLPVVLYSAAPFFRHAWRDLRLRRAGMDVPVALGVGMAFLASVWATLSRGGEVYFDAVTMFVFFLLCGRYLEMQARHRSLRAIENIGRSQPAFADRLRADPEAGSERVPVSELRSGDRVRIAPGQAVPADGAVLQGNSEIDESLLTGEARPIAKAPGDALTGGTLNIRHPLVMTVERVGEATRLAAIVRLTQRALGEKPRLVEQADRVAAGFVLVVLALALVTMLIWSQIDPSRMLWIFVAVLVVSCPCALSLATPAALAVATGAFARLGLLVARGHAIETLGRANHFVFDKTGTLTRGRLQLQEVLVLGPLPREEVLALAAQLEQGAAHPVGRALQQAAGRPPAVPIEDFTTLTGQGVAGRIGERGLRIGRAEFVGEAHRQPLPEAARQRLAAGDPCVLLGDASGWLALFRFEDTLRPGARELIGGLLARGQPVSLLSGDDEAATRRVAEELGIADFRAAMSPQDKHDFIAALQARGRVVAMSGDGVNDGPVLARAQISLAMGGGTDLARNQADMVLLGEDLGVLVRGLDLARRSRRVMHQNLGWAFAYNLLAIPLAMGGWVTPWMAGIGMSASSLLVVLNAMRLSLHRSA